MSIPTSFVVSKDDGFRAEIRLTWLPESYSIYDIALIQGLMHILGSTSGPNFGPDDAAELRRQFEQTMQWSPSKIHAGFECGWHHALAGSVNGGMA